MALFLISMSLTPFVVISEVILNEMKSLVHWFFYLLYVIFELFYKNQSEYI